MSSTTDSFCNYIAQTLAAEEEIIARQEKEEESQHQKLVAARHRKLQAALDANKPKKAIRIVYHLLEDDEENEDLEAMYQFLLMRVGVDRREPWFSFSREPLVKTISFLLALVPTVFLAVHFLGSGEPSTTSGIDVAVCVLAALFLCIPSVDCMIASIFNRINYYQLRD